MDHGPVTAQLQAWAEDVYGPAARIDGVAPMPGHSGYSFGFTLAHDGTQERLVVRLPPPGSKQRGSSDVLRQSQVMAAMGAAGVPVPQVRHQGDGERWFGTPYYVVTWVTGRSTSLYREGITHTEDGAGLEPVFVSAMEALAAIHAVDWRLLLPDWSTPATLGSEIAKWQPTLRKSSNQRWIEDGVELARILDDTKPSDPPPGVFHGDYYSNNWLFDDTRITAVVDWEISGIGPAGIDYGWVAMFYDDEAWGPSRHRWEAWRPTPEFLLENYARATGREPAHPDWYRALANYRLACITARAYELHVTGKHVDDAWDINGEAFPLLVAQARRLLGA